LFYSVHRFVVTKRGFNSKVVVLHLATAVSLACSPSARHSSTWHQHAGNIRTCSQQVLQELLAIGMN
jgi:hypothetical protein